MLKGHEDIQIISEKYQTRDIFTKYIDPNNLQTKAGSKLEINWY